MRHADGTICTVARRHYCRGVVRHVWRRASGEWRGHRWPCGRRSGQWQELRSVCAVRRLGDSGEGDCRLPAPSLLPRTRQRHAHTSHGTRLACTHTRTVERFYFWLLYAFAVRSRLYPPPRARHTDLPPLCETTVALPPSVLRPEVPDRTCDSMDRTHIRDIKYAPVQNEKLLIILLPAVPRSRTGAERCRWGNLYPFYRLSYNAFSFVVTD